MKTMGLLKNTDRNSLSFQEPVKGDTECKMGQCFEKMENPFMALNSESKRTHFFGRELGMCRPSRTCTWFQI